MGYLEYVANEKKVPVSRSLKGTMELAREMHDQTNHNSP